MSTELPLRAEVVVRRAQARHVRVSQTHDRLAEVVHEEILLRSILREDLDVVAQLAQCRLLCLAFALPHQGRSGSSPRCLASRSVRPHTYRIAPSHEALWGPKGEPLTTNTGEPLRTPMNTKPRSYGMF